MLDWQVLVSEHGPQVWRIVYRILAHHEDARDCYQEVMLAGWKYSQRQSVADWGRLLATIAVRTSLSRLRAKISVRNAFPTAPETEVPTSNEPTPTARAEASELLDRLREVLAQLPEKQALALWLSSVENCSYREIGTTLGVSTNEVGVLVHRARARMRESLDRDDCLKGVVR